jgi:hypothetical protein
MPNAPDVAVREYDLTDRSFLNWTLRTSARRFLQYNPLQEDTTLDQRVERAAGVIERRSREGWVVLVASWRGDRCGLLIAPPSGAGAMEELGVPGLAVARSGARVFMDRWYLEMGVEPALDEAADLARQATGLRRGPPRGAASA